MNEYKYLGVEWIFDKFGGWLLLDHPISHAIEHKLDLEDYGINNNGKFIYGCLTAKNKNDIFATIEKLRQLQYGLDSQKFNECNEAFKKL